MQAGQPRRDIAIWQKITVYPGHVQLRTYEPTDLEDAGFTYEYLTPGNLALPSAKVVDGVLAPDAQAFKALVVRANDSMTVDGVAKLVEFAQAGLPIVLAGGVPETYVGTYSPIALRASQRSLRSITSLPNVHVTDSYLVGATLDEIGIHPRTGIRSASPSNATLFTDWRHDPETDTDYVFVYNDAMYIPQGQGSAEATIKFETAGVPYEYNAWTGEQMPVLAYNVTENSTIIPLKLAGNQSTIFAFECADSGVKAAVHLNELGSSVVGYQYADNGSLVIKIAGSSSRIGSYSSNSSNATILGNWNLVVEHWEPTDDLYNITATHKYNTTHTLPSLVSWQQIPGLANVSGRGYYSTSFQWDGSADGAILDFGWIYHTLRVSLNGKALPPLDVTAAKADVGKLLVAGENTVEAVVATPLGNVLLPIWDQLQTSGEGPGSPDSSTVPPPRGDYGLQANVMLIPYTEDVVGGADT